MFVAEVSEIEKGVDALHAGVILSSHWFTICPLHANSSAADKKSAMCPAERGTYKIIVATNVAETSITIDGIKFVINYGMEKKLI